MKKEEFNKRLNRLLEVHSELHGIKYSDDDFFKIVHHTDNYLVSEVRSGEIRELILKYLKLRLADSKKIATNSHYSIVFHERTPIKNKISKPILNVSLQIVGEDLYFMHGVLQEGRDYLLLQLLLKNQKI